MAIVFGRNFLGRSIPSNRAGTTLGSGERGKQPRSKDYRPAEHRSRPCLGIDMFTRVIDPRSAARRKRELLRGIVSGAIRSVTGLLCRVGQSRFRSEEPTSDIQSPCNLVCRLLLEKTRTRDAQPG